MYDVKVTAGNKSAYTMDKVTIILNYMKKDSSIFKRDTLQFNQLKPGQVQKLDAPESNKAVSVELKMGKMESSELGL